MDYEQLVQKALRTVVKESLLYATKKGLPGSHHFYIAFSTDHPGVDLPDYLREQYADEITIVLQHEFWDLVVEEDRFAVTLCFNDIHERLLIPFDAIVSFVDPSVKFGLQFTPNIEEQIEKPKKVPTKLSETKEKSITDDLESTSEEPGSNVVTLDTFRKKP
ncbi:MAG: hypothetical protein K2W94_01860 [Alphaproteobacteria bacterium]|nr:hypothetical protein [Alphaproteobacteria bacterium]